MSKITKDDLKEAHSRLSGVAEEFAPEAVSLDTLDGEQSIEVLEHVAEQSGIDLQELVAFVKEELLDSHVEGFRLLALRNDKRLGATEKAAEHTVAAFSGATLTLGLLVGALAMANSGRSDG